jgi:hypothetical protein
MSKAARAQLVKSVLTSLVTYNATIFPLPKWLVKKIDKLRRNFFFGKVKTLRETRGVSA